MTLLAAAVVVLVFVTWAQSFWWEQARSRERLAFDAEREKWRVERSELLTRIQAPQAAPFMFESEPEDAENDLPLPPEFLADAEELEKAQRALTELGYDEGPAT